MGKLHILHLEDDATDAMLVQRAIAHDGAGADITLASTPNEFQAQIEKGGLDLILADHGLTGFSGQDALNLARQKCPDVPFIFVSGTTDEKQILNGLNAGAAGHVLKDQLWQLVAAVRLLRSKSAPPDSSKVDEAHYDGMKRLVAGVQELSLARTLESVMAVVRRVARELTGADGATFILRDGDRCHYVDEDAIGPLWKGQRFPISACISGWAMLNRQPAVIEDIYVDPRIPVDAYRPTFVKSLVMVPIRTESPIGAIGNYWGYRHLATPAQVELLQALANTTSVALENVQVYAGLEQRVRERTEQLEAANRELEGFSYSVSHDLRAPVRHVQGYAGLLADSIADRLDERQKSHLDNITTSAQRMGQLIDDLLAFSRIGRAELRTESVNMKQLFKSALNRMEPDLANRNIVWKVADLPEVRGDANLLRQVWVNLASNAVKYTRPRDPAIIEVGATAGVNEIIFHVRDNGVGFSMNYADKLFGVFKRLHTEAEFEGTGIGLANVRRIVERHGGRVWADATPDHGATFFFSLPKRAV